jgi:hypothetical protein
MTARRFFLLFGLCAVVPLVAAQLSLKFGWFSTVGTNKGIWMDKEIQLLPDLIAEPSSNSEAANIHWRLVYLQPENCDQGCERAMLTLQQLYSGLGRKQLKIKPLVVVPHGRTRKTLEQKFPDLDWQSVVDDTSGLENQIVIVNQRGLVLLRYPVTKEPEQMQDLAKNIRADLLHLINYDRSGA